MLEHDKSGPVGTRVGKRASPVGRLLPSTCPQWVQQPPRLTLLPRLGDDVSCALAHHFGDIQGAVGLIGNGDGAVHSFSLDLRESREHENSAHPQAHLRPHSPTETDGSPKSLSQRAPNT